MVLRAFNTSTTLTDSSKNEFEFDCKKDAVPIEEFYIFLSEFFLLCDGLAPKGNPPELLLCKVLPIMEPR
jgi:hypothetical protein